MWVGTKDQLTPDGKIASAYPTSYASTLRNEWGIVPMNTSDFIFGADSVFASDCYGSPAQQGACPWPATPEASIAVFENTAALLNASFTFARQLGVRWVRKGEQIPRAFPSLPLSPSTPTEPVSARRRRCPCPRHLPPSSD